MGSGIIFPICALPFSILILILFLKKDHVINAETKTYKVLIILNFIGLILEILCTVASLIYADFMLISNIIYKSYLVYLLIWTGIFTYYIYKITINKETQNKYIKRGGILFLIIISLIVYILPIELVIKNDFKIRYTIGPSVSFSYIISGIMVITIIAFVTLNIKNIKSKKFIPVFIFLLLGSCAIAIQIFRPEFLLLTYVETLICVVMYFTIENPDLKMIDELQKNKSLVETSMEDKSLFLFKMSQDIKEPVKNISSLIKEYNTNKLTKEEINNNYRMIENNINNLNFIINDIVNVSDIDISKVKVVNTTYDVNNLFESIKKQAENSLKEKQDIEFRYDISNAIPKELYGDYIKLKQIITTILNNSIKYTNKGLIELDVDAITRYDLCRLIIKISDTGCGMSLDQINDILRNNYEFEEDEYEKLDNLHLNLEMVIKLIRILGGNINIKSDIDHGTEVTIILDQKVKLEEKSSGSKNISNYANHLLKTKVLVVDDNSEELNKIVKILSKSDIPTNIAMYGKECIDKIKSGEKYKIILMDDEMKPDNALPTLEELKKIKKFNIPVIIMINKEKEFIKEHYIKDGFTDYILKDKMDKELERIINKYL